MKSDAELSSVQKHVINLMREGWAMGKSEASTGGVWLQKDGVGRGGPTESVKIGTFLALARRNFIRCKSKDFPTSEWVINDE